MDIRNLDIYNLPKWFSDIIEEVDILCEEALRSSVSYNKITEERYGILDKHGFISRLTDDGGGRRGNKGTVQIFCAGV